MKVVLKKTPKIVTYDQISSGEVFKFVHDSPTHLFMKLRNNSCNGKKYSDLVVNLSLNPGWVCDRQACIDSNSGRDEFEIIETAEIVIT